MTSHFIRAKVFLASMMLAHSVGGCSSEPAPLALSTPEEAIKTMIGLLESEEHERFMRECIAPDDLQKIMRYNRFRLSLDNMQRKEGKVVLSDLRVIQELTPEMSADGTTAFYPTDQVFGGYRALVNVNDKWYMPTRLPEYNKPDGR